MKKLLIITNNLATGGSERVISELVSYFVSQDIQCSIVRLRYAEITYAFPKQVEILTIDSKFTNYSVDRIWKFLEVRKIVKETNPDIVLSLPEETAIYVVLALIGLKVPVVVSERNNPYVMPTNKITRLARKIAYPFADGIIFQTEGAANFFSNKIKSKSVILPNPLNVERIPTPWKGNRVKEIIGAGRLSVQKNFPLLIQAFGKFSEMHPDYKMKIYGDGPQKNQLIDLVDRLGLKGKVFFPGKSSDLLNEINRGSMFILSSNYEGMPNILIETMAMGMPVISTDSPTGGPKTLINHKENGILVPTNNITAMVEAMKYIATSPSVSKKLSENAIEIREKLDSKIISKRWEEYLNDVLDKKNSD